MRLAMLMLAGIDKRGNYVHGSTAVMVNPEHVAKVQPVVIELDDAGFPTNGVTQITYAWGEKELVQGTVKDVTNTLESL